MQKRVASNRGEELGEDGSGQRCPGESCERWMSGGPTPEERDEACRGCPVCAGRAPGAETAEELKVQMVCDRVERMALERNTEGSLDKTGVDPLLWELLLIWDRTEREFMHLNERRVAMLLDALARRGV